MEVISTYHTLKLRTEGLYKEKGSKFIGIAQSCYSEEEAKELLSEWKKEHHQAGHLCYAYRFGKELSVFRANDDGEPSNSAGAPILGQIQSFGLTNVLIGVVRYYGGTKLGVGGLINAYRTAAKEALEINEIIEVEVFHHYRLTFDYPIMSDVMYWLKKANLEYKNQLFEVDCQLEVAFPLMRDEQLLAELKEFEGLSVLDLGEY